ncbi:MAG: tryptophan transporter [Peptostreptococcaceae bacterium]|nr:tryptophan transporter [Peptostreptococcaceae bacterium]
MKHYVMTALMLAMGWVLHAAVPGVFGMKFDLLLVFMILAIVLYPTLKNAFLAGVGGGVLTALTTTFPGGQIPNFIDKAMTAMIILILFRLLSGVSSEKTKTILLSCVGTLISGSIFLTAALLIVGLPAPFFVLFTGVVLPTCLGNTLISVVVYKACRLALKQTSLRS